MASSDAAAESHSPGAAGGGFRGLERLGQKAAVMFGGNVLGALLGFVALLAIGRYYDPGAYGAYLFAVSLIGIVNTLFALGFNEAHVREMARGVPVDRALGVYVRIRVILNAAKLLVVLLAFLLWFIVLDRGFTDATSIQVVIIILCSSILTQFRKIADDTWTGQGRVHRVEWGNLVGAVVWAGLVALIGIGLGAASGRWVPLPGLGEAVAGLLSLPASAGPMVLARYVALAHFLSRAAALALAAFWWLRDRTEIGPWDPAVAGDYRRFALPVALTSILALVLQHTDVLMLGFFWTTREVGWYGAAQKLANVALLANIALRGLLMPYFASLFSRGEGERAMRAFRQVERFLLMAVIPLAVAMMVWSREGLHIFVGDSFLGAAPALRWLAAWTLLSAMVMPLRAKHMGAGETRALVAVSVTNVLVNIGLNLVLIPQSILGIPLAGLGHEGAAAATFGSTLVAYSLSRALARRYYGIPLVDGTQLRMGLTALAPATLWLWLRATLAPTAYDRVWELTAIGVVGAGAYLLALWATRSLTRADVRLVRQVIHPREIVREARGRG